MKYKYTYRLSAFELWQFSMYYAYWSIMGIFDLFFTLAACYLLVTQWNSVDPGYKFLLVVCASLFTIVQPLSLYLKARKQHKRAQQQDTTVEFSDQGIHVVVGEQQGDTEWKTVRRVVKRPGMIFVYMDSIHAFILPDSVTKEEKTELYTYLKEKTKR